MNFAENFVVNRSANIYNNTNTCSSACMHNRNLEQNTATPTIQLKHI